MTQWDSHIFTLSEPVEDFLADLAELDTADRVEALIDAITTAQKHAAPGEEDHTLGLLAASIAAIWHGAPYSAGPAHDAYPFIRRHDAALSDVLQEHALQLLDAEFERSSDSAEGPLEGLETYVEALS